MVDFMDSDHELITLARQGDEFAEEKLARRYSKLVRVCARPFFLAGGDSEDLIQEGMLGLLSAIRKYDLNGSASFKTYAEQCIRNRLITAIESASRLKHMPLNEGVSFDDVLCNDTFQLYAHNDDTFLRQTEDTVLAKESEYELYLDQVKRLSKFEKEVLMMYLSGMSYREIAIGLNKSEKSIDNAIQRIRKKYAQMDKAIPDSICRK